MAGCKNQLVMKCQRKVLVIRHIEFIINIRKSTIVNILSQTPY